MSPELPSPVGLKMPLGWRESPEWDSLSKPHDDLLQQVADWGLSHVEFSTGGCRERSERERARTEAEACAERGLATYLHPYMGNGEDPCCYDFDARCGESMHRVIDTAADVARRCGMECVVVFHPGSSELPPGADDRAEYRRKMVERAGRYLKALEDRLKREDGRVRAVVEHQVPPGRDEPLMRVGDTFEELLQVVRPTKLGICWDTGHYMRSMDVYGQPGEPPDEMFERTGYVHLHDVVDGADHRPVTAGSSGPRSFMQGLWQRGYRSPVTLEYHEKPMLERGGLEKSVRTALDALSKWAGA